MIVHTNHKKQFPGIHDLTVRALDRLKSPLCLILWCLNAVQFQHFFIDIGPGGR